jgi:hypothetical protein
MFIQKSNQMLGDAGAFVALFIKNVPAFSTEFPFPTA